MESQWSRAPATCCQQGALLPEQQGQEGQDHHRVASLALGYVSISKPNSKLLLLRMFYANAASKS